jgi:hypothetical protein
MNNQKRKSDLTITGSTRTTEVKKAGDPGVEAGNTTVPVEELDATSTTVPEVARCNLDNRPHDRIRSNHNRRQTNGLQWILLYPLVYPKVVDLRLWFAEAYKNHSD